MCLTNNQMDAALEAVYATERYANEHASDNSGDHVGGRFGFLHGAPMLAVPVRPGTVIEPPPGRLFPAKFGTTKPGAYTWRPAWPRPGIIAPLRDENTGLIAEYYIESNGLNAVEVTGKV